MLVVMILGRPFMGAPDGRAVNSGFQKCEPDGFLGRWGGVFVPQMYEANSGHSLLIYSVICANHALYARWPRELHVTSRGSATAYRRAHVHACMTDLLDHLSMTRQSCSSTCFFFPLVMLHPALVLLSQAPC